MPLCRRFQSEKETGDRNFAIGYYMKEKKVSDHTENLLLRTVFSVGSVSVEVLTLNAKVTLIICSRRPENNSDLSFSSETFETFLFFFLLRFKWPYVFF